MIDYWDNICEIHNRQTRKGIREYGQTLEENTSLTYEQRITMLEEELVDALVYLEHLKISEHITINNKIQDGDTTTDCEECETRIRTKVIKDFAEWLPKHFDLRFSNNPNVWIDEYFHHTSEKVFQQLKKPLQK